MSSLERFNIASQTEHLQLKYAGTGHADLTKHEWMTAQHRDTIASFVGHAHLTHMAAIASGQASARVRYEMLQRMPRPCGEDRKETPAQAAQAAMEGSAQQ